MAALLVNTNLTIMLDLVLFAQQRPDQPLAMLDQAMRRVVIQPTVPVPLVVQDFTSQMMGARVSARHTLIALVLLVNIILPVRLQPIAPALPVLREQPKLVPRLPRAAPPVLLGPSA